MNRIMKTFLSFAVIAGLSVSAFAQDAAKKETPPPGSAPKAFKVPPRERFTLPNGMRVSLVQYGDMPKATISARVRVGGLNEPANEVSVTDFVVELMKEGTKTRSADQIAAEAASMGGAVETGAGADQSTVSMDVLSEFAPKAVDLVADVLLNPVFPEKDFERIRNDQLRNVSIARSRPQTMANERFRKVLYGDHPYSNILPTDAVLKALTLDEVKKYYNDNFGAERTDLYVAGKFDSAAVKAAITKAFGSWKKGPDPVMNPPKLAGKHSLDFIDKASSPQSPVMIGLPVLDHSNPDYVPMLVTDVLLG